MRTEIGTATTRIPRKNTVDCTMCVVRLPWVGLSEPSVRSRTVSTQIETGLIFAQACSQPGTVLAGTNAELANTNGKIRVKLAAWTASTLFNESPVNAASHVNAYPTHSTPATASTALGRPAWIRNPTNVATTSMRCTWNVIAAVSAK